MSTSDVAGNFLLLNWDGSVPVNLVQVCRRAGYTVTTGHLEEGVCCKMQMKKGVPVMTLASGMDEQRQRYALAHALGHCLLGHLQGQAIWEDRAEHYASNVASRLEAQANAVAMQLLMPLKSLEYVLEHKQKDYPDLDSIAKLFGVSQLALFHRLKQLGIVH